MFSCIVFISVCLNIYTFTYEC